MSYLMMHGDSLSILGNAQENSVDSLVTDPPAGISFMGREWDHDHGGREGWVKAFSAIFKEALRVLKPGAHGLVWAIPRTSHWTATALEDAGFEVRDIITHVFGSGFPKSLNISKASKVEKRYGTKTCVCMDPGVGLLTRDDAGCGSSENNRIYGKCTTGQAIEAKNPDVQIHSRPVSDPMCELWQCSTSSVESKTKIEAPILHAGLCGHGAEKERHGNVEIREGLGQDQDGNSQERRKMSSVSTNGAVTGSSHKAVSLRRNEQSEQFSDSMRFMSPQDRGDHHQSIKLDTDRRFPRSVVIDNFGGTNGTAKVCTWCGFPDVEWKRSIAPLGTALKPAAEHWILVRKPLIGTVIENVLEHGTGGINIDGCRIGLTPNDDIFAKNPHTNGTIGANGVYGEGKPVLYSVAPSGRWPANLVLSHSEGCKQVGINVVKGYTINRFTDGAKPFGNGAGHEYSSTDMPDEEVPIYECEPDCAVRLLNDQTANLKGGVAYEPSGKQMERSVYGKTNTLGRTVGFGDSGGASRFFYCAKASKKDKNSADVANNHPTVKNTALMAYLCRLVTPPGGTVLDCFAGSGSTGVAALREGFDFVGIEMDKQYFDIACARLNGATNDRK